MAIYIEAVSPDGSIARTEIRGEDIAVPADPGVRYRIVDERGDTPDTLRLRREGADLTVDGVGEPVQVRIDGFFANCGPGSCDWSFEADGTIVQPGSEPVAALKDGSFLMYAGQAQPFEAPSTPESEFNWRPVAGIGAGVAILGAIGGGGGDSVAATDTVAPAAPSIKDSAATNVRKPVISGTAEPNSTVTVTIELGDSGNRVSYSTNVNGNGEWRVDTAIQRPFAGVMPDDGLPADQVSTVRAIATDAAGNNSPVGESRITIDTVPPEQLAKITAAASDAAEPVDDQGVATNTNGAPLRPGPLADGGQTNDRSPTFNGTIDAPLAPGDRVLVYRDGSLAGEATLDGQNWQFTDANVPAGQHTYEARVVDVAGNSAPNANTFTLFVDGTPPQAPSFDPIAGDDIVDFSEAQAGFAVTGSAEAGSRIVVTWGQGSRETQADADGRFRLDYARDQLPGNGTIAISATATDTFGNTGQAALRPVVLATTLPEMPALETGSGVLAGGTAAINAAEAANLVITGTATPGNRVTLSFTPESGGPTLRFEGQTNQDGVFSVPIARNALPDGRYRVQPLATDIVGNEAPAGSEITVLVDTVAPGGTAAIDRADDDRARETGEIANGGLTNDTSPTLSGDAGGLQAGDRVRIERDGNAVGEARLEGGRFVFTDSDLVDGRFAYTARIIDAAGNPGIEGPFFELVVDATAPQAPTIAPVADDDRVTGSETGGGVLVAGTAAPAAVVEVTWGGQSRQLTADAAGNWSTRFDNPPQGRQDIRATVVDAAGNEASSSRSVLVDTIPPANPEIFTVEGDNVVNAGEAANGIAVSGRSEAGARIELGWSGRSTSTTADGGGFWSASFGSVPSQGGSTITAVAIDAAGNRSGQSARSVSVDTVAPATPTVAGEAGDGQIDLADAAGGIQIGGQTEAGARVRVDWAGAIRETTANGSGNWQVTYADAPRQGPSTIRATASDAAGNTSGEGSRSVTVNTIPPPDRPTIDTVAGDDRVNESEADDGVRVSGSAQAGSTVEVDWGSATRTVSADGSGRWSVNFTSGQVPSDGTTTVSVTASNSGGTSPAETRQVVVDTDPPSDPSIAPVEGNNRISAAEAADGVVVSGSAEGGSTVTVQWGGVELTDLASGGTWSVRYAEVPVEPGQSQIRVFATDAAGNRSDVETRTVTVDQPPPSTTAGITAVQDDVAPDTGTVPAGGTTDDATPTLTLTLSSVLSGDESLVIFRNGSEVAELTPSQTGVTYESEALVDGSYQFTAQVRHDDSGLTGPLSAPYGITIETAVP